MPGLTENSRIVHQQVPTSGSVLMRMSGNVPVFSSRCSTLWMLCRIHSSLSHHSSFSGGQPLDLQNSSSV